MKDWRFATSVFFIAWGVVTCPINSLNAKYFGLQNATIAGLSDHGTFGLLDQAIPGFNLVEGDETFRYQNQVFPLKQPGQTIVGSIIYTPLKYVGIEWKHHYDYASNIITMMTSGVGMAIVATLLFLISKSYLAPAIFVLGTIAWPYAGVSHHDIYAMMVGFVAVYLVYCKRYISAGIAAGMTLFFSMLPLTLPLGLGILILLITKEVKILIRYGTGVATGLAPSLVFNYLNFGNPLLFPNLAGKIADTMPMWDIANFAAHINFYLTDPKSALWAFSPILLFGIIGYKKLRQTSRMLAYAAVIIPTLQLLHICTQQTFGGYQYGPRYLLPTLPLLSLLAASGWEKLGAWARKIFVLLFGYSIFVAAVGAITTAMYPMPNTPFAPFAQLIYIVSNQLPSYRLLPAGILLILIGVLTILNGTFKHHNPVGRLDL
ncbi:MAG: hypothetical protein WCL07_00195 [bacterium]